jgi:hypothetical protein
MAAVSGHVSVMFQNATAVGITNQPLTSRQRP